ncbi:MAG: hypothetical protein OXG98_00025 [Gemmatimonadetes bacterium]|nr:hypothetical protein [Gemmatimonadota bacterium]
MNHGKNHSIVDQASVERGHEVFETNVPLVIKFGIGLTVLAVISMVLMWLMFIVIEDYNAMTFETPSPMIEENVLPPEPRIQVIPEEDLIALQEAEAKKLNNYGWVIRTAEIVQIPIERAMHLIATDDRYKLPSAEGTGEGQ